MADQETTANTGAPASPSAISPAQPETATPAVVVTATEEPTSPTTATIRSYDHGFTNGLLRIEANDFEVFAEESERLEFVQRQLRSVTNDLQRVRQKQVAVQEQRLSLTEARLEAEAQQEALRSRLVKTEEKLAESAAAREAIFTEKKTLKPPYSWPPAILYLLAGVIFIIADVAVMHDIALNGLNIGGIESWIFSVGLACVAFLLKPAVDRVLEKPYAAGEKVERNHRVLIIFAALALITLAVLGYFRGDATSIANRKDELNTQYSNLNNQRDQAEEKGGDVTSIDQSLAQVKVDINTVEGERANSVSMRVGLILAAVLFAIAGAVCLGIAFPAINALHRSHFVLRNRLRRITRRMVPLTETLHTLEADIAQQYKQREQVLFTFNELPDLSQLGQRLAELMHQEVDLLEQQYKCQALRQQSMYRDGKARGLIYELQGNLSYSVSDADRRITENSNSNGYSGTHGASDGSPESSRRNPGKRPYVVLRRLISQHYTRHRPNGHTESIEIE